MAKAINQKALCVDLDGTLIENDLFRQDLAKLFHHRPNLTLKAFKCALLGKGNLKNWLSTQFEIDFHNIKFRNEVLELLNKQKKRGTKIFLATAAARIHAERIAQRVGIFDGVFSSTEKQNLKGSRKADVLEHFFGTKGFDYLGDSWADIPVWRRCNQAIVCGYDPVFLRRIHQVNPTATPLLPNHSL